MPVVVLPDQEISLPQSASPANLGVHFRGTCITIDEEHGLFTHDTPVQCQGMEPVQIAGGDPIQLQDGGVMAVNDHHRCRICLRLLFWAGSVAALLHNCHHLVVCQDCAIHVRECPVCGENVLCFMSVPSE